MSATTSAGESSEIDVVTKFARAAIIGDKCMHVLKTGLGIDGEAEVDGEACELISEQIDRDNPNIVVILMKVNVETGKGTMTAAHHEDGELHTVQVTTDTP